MWLIALALLFGLSLARGSLSEVLGLVELLLATASSAGLTLSGGALEPLLRLQAPAARGGSKQAQTQQLMELFERSSWGWFAGDSSVQDGTITFLPNGVRLLSSASRLMCDVL